MMSPHCLPQLLRQCPALAVWPAPPYSCPPGDGWPAVQGPHFWDECVYPPTGPCTVPPSGDFEGYIQLFADAAAGVQRRRGAISGEASSNTFTATNGVFLR
jgi:hypothetical protein